MASRKYDGRTDQKKIHLLVDFHEVLLACYEDIERVMNALFLFYKLMSLYE